MGRYSRKPANLPDLNVGISASNINVCGQCRRFFVEDFELLASTGISLAENVFVESGLRPQGQARGAFDKSLCLALSEIGKQKYLQCLLFFFASLFTIAGAGKRIDIGLAKWPLLARHVLDGGRIALQIPGEHIKFGRGPAPAKSMSFSIFFPCLGGISSPCQCFS